MEAVIKCEQFDLRGGQHGFESGLMSDEALKQRAREERLQHLPEASATQRSEIVWLFAQRFEVADLGSSCKKLELKTL